jgi:hypothetical protein
MRQSLLDEGHMGALFTDFLMVKAGALHRANCGFLVIEALELLKQYFSWDPLKRTLKNKRIKIEEPGEQFRMVSTVTLEPEPIPLDLKVILLGSPWLYYLLHTYDPEFAELFKVKVDFASGRTPENVGFSRSWRRPARGLRPRRGGKAGGTASHGGIRSGCHQLRRDADVAWEASFWAERSGTTG